MDSHLAAKRLTLIAIRSVRYESSLSYSKWSLAIHCVVVFKWSYHSCTISDKSNKSMDIGEGYEISFGNNHVNDSG